MASDDQAEVWTIVVSKPVSQLAEIETGAQRAQPGSSGAGRRLSQERVARGGPKSSEVLCQWRETLWDQAGEPAKV